MNGIAHKRQHRHKFAVATHHHFETQSNQYPCALPSLSYSGPTPSPVGVSRPACEAPPRNSCRLVPHNTSPHRGACDLILRALIHCTHAISQPKNRRSDRGARFGNKQFFHRLSGQHLERTRYTIAINCNHLGARARRSTSIICRREG
jgi:hypothetical protein